MNFITAVSFIFLNKKVHYFDENCHGEKAKMNFIFDWEEIVEPDLSPYKKAYWLPYYIEDSPDNLIKRTTKTS